MDRFFGPSTTEQMEELRNSGQVEMDQHVAQIHPPPPAPPPTPTLPPEVTG